MVVLSKVTGVFSWKIYTPYWQLPSSVFPFTFTLVREISFMMPSTRMQLWQLAFRLTTEFFNAKRPVAFGAV